MMGTPMNTVWSSNDANKTNTKSIREHSCHSMTNQKMAMPLSIFRNALMLFFSRRDAKAQGMAARTFFTARETGTTAKSGNASTTPPGRARLSETAEWGAPVCNLYLKVT